MILTGSSFNAKTGLIILLGFMNAITYSLCGKPVIGLVMFATGLCVFPNPVERAPISLGNAGSSAQAEFEAPVSKPYYLELVFAYTEGKSQEARSLVGERQVPTCSVRYASPDAIAADSAFPGVATPVEVTIQSVASRSVVEHFFLSGSCGASWYAKGEIGRTLTAIDLQQGKYSLTVKNLKAHEALRSVTANISLSPGSGK